MARRTRSAVLLAALLPLLQSCLEEAAPRPWTARQARGFNVACWRRGCLASPALSATLREASARGARDVALVVTWYVPDARSGAPAPHPHKSPSLAELEAAAGVAAARGLDVWLKPHVDRLDGGSRTEIAPADEPAWWGAYRDYVLAVARVGRRVGAEVLVLGTELRGLSAWEQRWRALLTRVRTEFPGTVTYAANWDELERVPFLGALDLVAVDGYFPLGPDPPPTALDVALGLNQHLARLRRLKVLGGRALVFTEIGAPSADRARQERICRGALAALRSEGGLLLWNLWQGTGGGTHVARQECLDSVAAAWR